MEYGIPEALERYDVKLMAPSPRSPKNIVEPPLLSKRSESKQLNISLKVDNAHRQMNHRNWNKKVSAHVEFYS